MAISILIPGRDTQAMADSGLLDAGTTTKAATDVQTKLIFKDQQALDAFNEKFKKAESMRGFWVDPDGKFNGNEVVFTPEQHAYLMSVVNVVVSAESVLPLDNEILTEKQIKAVNAIYRRVVDSNTVKEGIKMEFIPALKDKFSLLRPTAMRYWDADSDLMTQNDFFGWRESDYQKVEAALASPTPEIEKPQQATSGSGVEAPAVTGTTKAASQPGSLPEGSTSTLTDKDFTGPESLVRRLTKGQSQRKIAPSFLQKASEAYGGMEVLSNENEPLGYTVAWVVITANGEVFVRSRQQISSVNTVFGKGYDYTRGDHPPQTAEEIQKVKEYIAQQSQFQKAQEDVAQQSQFESIELNWPAQSAQWKLVPFEKDMTIENADGSYPLYAGVVPLLLLPEYAKICVDDDAANENKAAFSQAFPPELAQSLFKLFDFQGAGKTGDNLTIPISACSLSKHQDGDPPGWIRLNIRVPEYQAAGIVKAVERAIAAHQQGKSINPQKDELGAAALEIVKFFAEKNIKTPEDLLQVFEDFKTEAADLGKPSWADRHPTATLFGGVTFAGIVGGVVVWLLHHFVSKNNARANALAQHYPEATEARVKAELEADKLKREAAGEIEWLKRLGAVNLVAEAQENPDNFKYYAEDIPTLNRMIDRLGRHADNRDIYQGRAKGKLKQNTGYFQVRPSGAGKTTDVQILARAIADGKAGKLNGYEVWSVDLGQLVVDGEGKQGGFERAIRGLLEEAKTKGNVILFFDEAGLLRYTGTHSGRARGADIEVLKYLADGTVPIMFATTDTEFAKDFPGGETDPLIRRSDLDRRPAPEGTLLRYIVRLAGVRRLQETENISFGDEENISRLVEYVIERSAFVSDFGQPHAALDLIDAAADLIRRGRAGALAEGEPAFDTMNVEVVNYVVEKRRSQSRDSIISTLIQDIRRSVGKCEEAGHPFSFNGAVLDRQANEPFTSYIIRLRRLSLELDSFHAVVNPQNAVRDKAKKDDPFHRPAPIKPHDELEAMKESLQKLLATGGYEFEKDFQGRFRLERALIQASVNNRVAQARLAWILAPHTTDDWDLPEEQKQRILREETARVQQFIITSADGVVSIEGQGRVSQVIVELEQDAARVNQEADVLQHGPDASTPARPNRFRPEGEEAAPKAKSGRPKWRELVDEILNLDVHIENIKKPGGKEERKPSESVARGNSNEVNNLDGSQHDATHKVRKWAEPADMSAEAYMRLLEAERDARQAVVDAYELPAHGASGDKKSVRQLIVEIVTARIEWRRALQGLPEADQKLSPTEATAVRGAVERMNLADGAFTDADKAAHADLLRFSEMMQDWAKQDPKHVEQDLAALERSKKDVEKSRDEVRAFRAELIKNRIAKRQLEIAQKGLNVSDEQWEREKAEIEIRTQTENLSSLIPGEEATAKKALKALKIETEELTKQIGIHTEARAAILATRLALAEINLMLRGWDEAGLEAWDERTRQLSQAKEGDDAEQKKPSALDPDEAKAIEEEVARLNLKDGPQKPPQGMTLSRWLADLQKRRADVGDEKDTKGQWISALRAAVQSYLENSDSCEGLKLRGDYPKARDGTAARVHQANARAWRLESSDAVAALMVKYELGTDLETAAAAMKELASEKVKEAAAITTVRNTISGILKKQAEIARLEAEIVEGKIYTVDNDALDLLAKEINLNDTAPVVLNGLPHRLGEALQVRLMQPGETIDEYQTYLSRHSDAADRIKTAEESRLTRLVQPLVEARFMELLDPETGALRELQEVVKFERVFKKAVKTIREQAVEVEAADDDDTRSDADRAREAELELQDQIATKRRSEAGTSLPQAKELARKLVLLDRRYDAHRPGAPKTVAFKGPGGEPLVLSSSTAKVLELWDIAVTDKKGQPRSISDVWRDVEALMRFNDMARAFFEPILKSLRDTLQEVSKNLAPAVKLAVAAEKLDHPSTSVEDLVFQQIDNISKQQDVGKATSSANHAVLIQELRRSGKVDAYSIMMNFHAKSMASQESQELVRVALETVDRLVQTVPSMKQHRSEILKDALIAMTTGENPAISIRGHVMRAYHQVETREAARRTHVKVQEGLRREETRRRTVFDVRP